MSIQPAPTKPAAPAVPAELPPVPPIPNAIPLILRREVREMVGDWRIVAPMLILSLLLPFIMAFAALFVIRFIDEDGFARLLLPFALVITGFIPASFTIITALESFVGERERNTLESLLAMPLSDRHLYISKFMAALVPPLIASFTSMTLFCLALWLTNAPAFAEIFPLGRLLLLYSLIVVLAITLVAGAVVISSHTSTIRAANLMSSFILLPVIAVLNFVAVWIIDGAWGRIQITVLLLALVGSSLVLLGVRLFSREEILARETRRAPRRSRRPAAASAGTAAAEASTALATAPVQQQLSEYTTTLTIMRREVRDTVADWRVLLPILLLAVALPLGGVWLFPLVLQVTDETLISIGQLVPFGVLIIGFVPASFALITALESFVGERERNSLEPLLASPISDQNLYLSKLMAALIVPLFTCVLAMLLFTSGMALAQPSLYSVAMTPLRVLLLFSIIVIITMLMVAAAVIISSHTSSLRAANLLASFVLVPIAIAIQIQAVFLIANRWDIVLATAVALAVVMVALIRTGLSIFNREEILSRANDQFNPQRIRELFGLYFREYQPAGVPSTRYHGLGFAPLRFYRHELPALLRELRPAFVLVALAVLTGLVVGWYAASFLPLTRLKATIISQIGTPVTASLALALGIALNNLRVSILSNVFSLASVGLFAFLVPAAVFSQIAFVVTVLMQNGGVWFSGERYDPFLFLMVYLLPHAIIELPTFMLSAALGIRMGASVLSPPGTFSVGHNMLWASANFAKVWLLLLLPLIIIAALIEGLVTTQLVTAVYGNMGS
ncbi:MAG: ABC transporter permease subunit [Chloroflexaceae bacterium]|nr:ABC transporter permease subunit [Chloroflexaceae bacterium]